MQLKKYSFIFLFIFLILLSCAPHLKDLDLTLPPKPTEEVKLTKKTATLVANFVASELSLNRKQKRKFIKDYVEEREAVVRRQLDIRLSGNQQDFTPVYRKNENGLLRVMEDNLNPDQSKKALNILRPDGRLGEIYGFVDNSVNRLIRGRVSKRKIKKTMPILINYHQKLAALTAEARSEGIVRREIRDKIIELRITTAKRLAPIIGQKAASFWLDLRTR